MPTRVVRLANGGVVEVREGTLQGVGPMGPEGPKGPPGPATTIRGYYATYTDLITAKPTGVQGDGYITTDNGHLYAWDDDLVIPAWVDAGKVVGPTGVIQSVGARRSASATQTGLSAEAWTALSFTTTDYNDTEQVPDAGGVLQPVACITVVSGTQVKVNHPSQVLYEVSASVVLTNPAGSTAGFRHVGLFRNLDAVPTIVGSVYDPGTDGVSNTVTFSGTLKASNADTWTVKVWNGTNAVAVTAAARYWTWARVGGGYGPQGPQGIKGDKGDKGDVGAPGSASTGFASFDAVQGAGQDTEADPGGSPTSTTDQGFPLPTGEQKPATPWFLKTLAQTLEKYVTARYNDVADFGTRRGVSEQGEVVYFRDTHQMHYAIPDGAGGSVRIQIPAVVVGTTDVTGLPATVGGVTVPDGTIYMMR